MNCNNDSVQKVKFVKQTIRVPIHQNCYVHKSLVSSAAWRFSFIRIIKINTQTQHRSRTNK